MIFYIIACSDDRYAVRIARKQGEYPSVEYGIKSLEAAKEKAEEYRRNDGRN